ncbi:ATP-binding protein [Nannocystis pusilla]|uniref:ATP-binding protein n=1 Tax=Nannocystis pusilla TaxID=889268 RepID=UPI003B7F90DF
MFGYLLAGLLLGPHVLQSGIELTHNFGDPIPPEHCEHIFDVFSRQRLHRRSEKLGLGLPLVRACAEAHGGTVEVESAPRAGRPSR